MNTPTTDAVSLLVDAADTITERGKQRDQPNGERSMARTVQAFNAIYGTALNEKQGWQFMSILKIARSSAGDFRADDYTDQAGYAALAGECAAREASGLSQFIQHQHKCDTDLAERETTRIEAFESNLTIPQLIAFREAIEPLHDPSWAQLMAIKDRIRAEMPADGQWRHPTFGLTEREMATVASDVKHMYASRTAINAQTHA